MRAAVAFPAAARPYPGEVAAVPVHEAGTAVPDPGWRPEPEPASPGSEAGEGGCTGRKADGGVCNGRAGDDGRCARHKEA